MKMIEFEWKEKVSVLKVLQPDGSKTEIRTLYRVGEPYYRCMECGRTRTLSQREKGELHEALGWK